MSEERNQNERPNTARLRFSIGTLLLWIAILALTAQTMIMSRRIARMERDVFAQRPLPAEEVKRQFEKNATLGPITTTVKDVRYSAEADAYRVKFSWLDSQSGKTWHSDVRLNHDGFGSYFGQIRNRPFVQPLGRSEFFSMVVKTPSPLAD